jgi:hypothetical protein
LGVHYWNDNWCVNMVGNESRSDRFGTTGTPNLNKKHTDSEEVNALVGRITETEPPERWGARMQELFQSQAEKYEREKTESYRKGYEQGRFDTEMDNEHRV